MASITSPGIGSGLDVNSIVTKLVASERAPVQNRLDVKEARIQGQLSALGSFRSALSNFQDSLDKLKSLDTFQARTAASTKPDLLTATADKSAVAGTYSVEVKTLAVNQKLSSQAFTDTATAIGTGALSLSTGGDQFTVDIDSSNNTLAGIRDAINNSADNTGVRASIVNAADGSHLLLTADKTGTANALTVTVSGGDGGLTPLIYDTAGGTTNMTEQQAAVDATVNIDGYDITSASNSIESAIQGVTLKLTNAEPGTTFDLTVADDKAGATAAVQSFVKSYNGLVDVIGKLSAYNPETQQAAPLQGDATLRNVQATLRREIGRSIDGLSGSYTSLASIGITTDVDGKLSVDSDKLSTAMDSNFDQIGQLFASDNGYAVSMDSTIGNLLESKGILDGRTEGLKTSLKFIGTQRDELDRRMTALEDRYRKQFTAMDTLVAQLQNTGSYLSQQLAKLPTPG